MALKKKILKEAFDKLSAEIKAMYKQDGEEYKLDLEADENDEDPAELKRALIRTRQEAKDAKLALQKKEEKEAEDAEALARGKGDLKTIEDSWKEKLRLEKEKGTATVKALKSQIERTLVDNVASAMAREVSNSPSLLTPVIKGRIRVEYDDEGVAVARILDKDGKVSALSVDDLRAEVVANPEFKSIILASKASGGARPASNVQQAAVPSNVPVIPGTQTADLTKFTPAQMVAHVKATKEAQNQAAT